MYIFHVVLVPGAQGVHVYDWFCRWKMVEVSGAKFVWLTMRLVFQLHGFTVGCLLRC